MNFFVRLFRRHSCSPVIEVRKSLYSAADAKDKPVQLAAVATDSNYLYPEDLPCSRIRGGASRRIAIDMSEAKPGMLRMSCADDLSSTSTSSAPDLERYMVISCLHKSRNSSILQAEDKVTGQVVVLKVYSRTEMSASSSYKLKSECKLQEVCKPCSSVVELINVIDNDLSTVLVLEYCTGGTLTEALARCGWKFSEPQASCLAKSLLQALCFLHEHQIVHRDIRPEHVLLSRAGQWKLADFGCAADTKVDHLNARVGHLLYLAPEVVLKPAPEDVFHEIVDKGLSEEELPCYDEKVDIWSLGVVICEVLIGRQPFLAETTAELWYLIREKHIGPGGVEAFLQQFGLSRQAVSFLSQALQPHPSLRKSAKSLLQHEWIRQYAPS